MLELRKARESDVAFLIALRDSTMRKYLEESGFPVNDKTLAQRVRDQFEWAQIVMLNGEDVGLLKVKREKKRWDLIQIQIVPGLQRKGLGKKLIQRVLSEAAAAGAEVELSVLKTNPAKRLYEQIGFRVVGKKKTEYVMRFGAQQAVPGSTPPLRGGAP